MRAGADEGRKELNDVNEGAVCQPPDWVGRGRGLTVGELR